MIQLRLCENIAFLLTGFDHAQANMVRILHNNEEEYGRITSSFLFYLYLNIYCLQTLVPYILGHEPGGTSARTVWHYGQEINSGKFCKFDHNSMFTNWLAYKSFSPPEYDLKKVDVPVALIWSDNDWLADPKVNIFHLNISKNHLLICVAISNKTIIV